MEGGPGFNAMKLVLYVKGFPPCEYGGQVTAAYNLLREFLMDSKVTASLIVQTDCSEETIYQDLGAPANLTVLRLRYFPSLQDLRTLPRVMRMLRQADLVHFNEFPFRHLVYLLLARLRGIPLVFRLGGFLSGEAEATFGPAYPLTILASRGRLRLRLPRGLVGVLLATYRWSTRFWTRVIMNSEALRSQAADKENFDPSIVSVIPNGVRLPADIPAPPEAHDGPIRLLFVGKLEKVKGPDLLFEALEILGQKGLAVDLSIAGTGSLEAPLRKWARKLPPHRITFLGVRHGEDLTHLYRGTDAVVVPSRYESCPMVVLESMAEGRPLVATRVGGTPEILASRRNALLVDADARSIAEGIHLLAENPDLRSEMARANLEDAHDYAWPAIAHRYREVYEEALVAVGH